MNGAESRIALGKTRGDTPRRERNRDQEGWETQASKKRREKRERERERKYVRVYASVCMCVRVCAREEERERERGNCLGAIN